MPHPEYPAATETDQQPRLLNLNKVAKVAGRLLRKALSEGASLTWNPDNQCESGTIEANVSDTKEF